MILSKFLLHGWKKIEIFSFVREIKQEISCHLTIYGTLKYFAEEWHSRVKYQSIEPGRRIFQLLSDLDISREKFISYWDLNPVFRFTSWRCFSFEILNSPEFNPREQYNN